MSAITQTIASAIDYADRLNAAIDRSIAQNEIVSIEVDAGDLDNVLLDLADGDCETDHVRLDDGTVDVWGWSDTTPADSMDWRLRLVLA